MVRVVYPGSFDPVTLGHLDIIKRASAAFDEVIIGVLNNSEKKSPLFTLEERVIMLKEVTSDLPNVSVECFGGLLVDFVKAKGSNIIVRGVRAMADFNIELQMAQTNRAVANDIDTVFFSTSTQYSAISSSVVKEYASYGVSVKDFVPAKVLPKIEEKYKKL
ncbi:MULTISPECIES: pantetheine-phosphate adenylyltransferase [Eubacterium]|uniref:Phosphopantetheine adenylyltransferase n=1 Tax=Eubacterium ruminantium TaxID=42322 RepID=A0A1T4LWS7_9FIRM|nr:MULTISPECIES: pantetheine-phosphate adenylyltransferase [Eubacterium]MCR5367619.1 pantetheine-phosphate adenylyltransferase [Eubacterium sp.]SCW39062.1 Phosphopantetheine adenylyltransferase [Eubacterium ruminantium]SDM43037.1 Phosphopantetheine adenylyltransferase [Eubacterium ruminantium]SJZ58894.1 Phosphopantetheine adenylyltransferase [Eubacterium ruminantium]